MSEQAGTQATRPSTSLQEVAYYHEPYWGQGTANWIKSLLLFFDGVAILVPEYMRDRPLITDPSLAQPLADRGLLHRLSPETLVNQTVTEALTDLLDRLLSAGAFDDLDRNSPFASISYSRLGGSADAGLTGMILEQLRKRGLAKPTTDGVSVPLHPSVRTFVLLILPQLLRLPAEAAGYALQPVNGRDALASAFVDTLNLSGMPTAGHVASFDLSQVTMNLSSVPLDEVLDFRERHGEAHRAYVRDLRSFVRDLALMDQAARDEAFADRRDALAETADTLQRLARKSWRKPLAAVSMGIAGAAVTLAHGDALGAALAAASALLGFNRQADPASAYSYIFKAQSQLAH